MYMYNGPYYARTHTCIFTCTPRHTSIEEDDIELSSPAHSTI